MSSDFSPSFKVLTDYLDANEYNYTPYPEENRINFNVAGHHANYRFVVRVTHDGEFLQISTYYPFFVRDEKLRISAAELITRANYNMPLGKLEMDMKDGEVHFHVTHLIDPLGLSTEVIERIFMTSFFTIDRYFPAFMQHIHAGYTPEDAVFHAELDSHAASVVEEPKMPKKKSGSKGGLKSSAKKEKLPAPEAQNADAELPTSSSEASPETPVVHKDPKEDQSHEEKPTAGGKGNQAQGQGELPL